MPADAAERCVRATLEAADAGRAVLQAWPRELDTDDNVYVLAFGKAAAGMARAAVGRLGGRCAGGIALVPPRWEPDAPSVLEVFPCDHPEPTARNLAAASRVLAWSEALPPAARVLVLISGGGSAYLTLPEPGVTLDDCRRVTRELNRAGASIGELNAVRANAELLKGGGLASVLARQRVLGLAVSDVIGDDTRVIASGPLSPAAGDRGDARAVLARYGVDPGTVLDGPPSVRVPGGAPVRVILNNDVARDAVAQAVGNGARVERAPRTGDASDVARAVVAAWRRDPTRAVVWGGETTVRVVGEGFGGPVQQMLLTIAIELEGEPFGAVGIATDGVDGPTDACGAAVDGDTAGAIRSAGLDAAQMLATHSAHPALEAASALLRTGPTGTNVNDVVAIWSGRTRE